MFQDDGSSKFLRDVHANQVFEIVNSVHVHELKHSGYKKVLDYVSIGRSSQFSPSDRYVQSDESDASGRE